MALLNGRNQHFIYLDEVRVPRDHLIGGEYDGWQVSRTTLEQEHGGRGQVFSKDEGLEELLRYVQEAKRHGQPLGGDPQVQLNTVENFLDSQVHAVLPTPFVLIVVTCE